MCVVVITACGQPLTSSQAWDISGSGSGSGSVDAPVDVELDASDGSDAPIEIVDAAVSSDASVPGDGPTCTGDCSSCTPDGCPCVAREIYAEAIDFDVDTLALAPGSYAQIHAMARLSDGDYVPASGLVWSSSDPSVVFVTPSGFVMVSSSAIDGATVTVTATTLDGSASTSVVITVTAGTGSGSGSGSGSATRAPT